MALYGKLSADRVGQDPEIRPERPVDRARIGTLTTRTGGTDSAIHVYFDFISPYGWIGAERIGAIAQRFSRMVHWHPILLKATVIDTMGLPPPLETPLKGAYLHHDIRRSLRYHGLELAKDARFGFSSLAAARLILWARAAAPRHVEMLVLGLYRAHWSTGRDISDPAHILDVAVAAGLSPSKVDAALQCETVKAALRDETAAAIAAGVFGSPTFIVDGEMFWGADRLAMAEAWIERGGW